MKGKNYIYDYQNYREFLIDALGGKKKRTGQRGALSRYISCQTAYLSQVLSGVANLNLEQGLRVNQFFGHDSQTSDYFLLLLQKERAGTHELKAYFQDKLSDILNKRSEIKSRVPKNKIISEQDQAYYYSHWYVGAIHVALSVPTLQTVSHLSRQFQLEESTVREVLEFLLSTGLAKFSKEKYSIGPSHIHTPKDSKFIKHLHTNWRLEAINSIDRKRDSDLHYSVAYSISKSDAAILRRQMLDLIEQNMEVVKPSKEEVLYCNTIDFFELRK
ncbi:MAG: TIGR02147 family protein [Bdellovibrionaceae bacterium]|nr:TIGR02147 family protein [Pseudobdellovibrionaceae bacterium]